MGEPYNALDTAVIKLGSLIDSRDFPEQAKLVQSDIRQERRISREERDHLLNELQLLWDKRKRGMQKRSEDSRNSRLSYFRELNSLDFSYDGAFMLQSFSNWERVGDKVRYARQQIKDIQFRIKNDHSLVKQDREEIRNRIDNIWFKIKNSEETAFMVHGEKASSLYNDAYAAVRDMPVGEAHAILKANNAELRTLYLSSSEREKYKSWFDDLWNTLKIKREKASDAWRVRQKEGLMKLNDVRNRLTNSLEKIRRNISDNESKYYSAKSSDFQDVIQGWIREGEDQASDLERRIDELDKKISEVEHRLDH